MAINIKKIEARVDFYLWTAPKVELYISPAFIQEDRTFSTSLQEYLEECPYHKLVYTEFLINDLSILTSEGGLDKTFRKVRQVCSQKMSELNTGCRFVANYPNGLSLEENLSISLVWRDLFAGFCIDLETVQNSRGLIEELQGRGALINVVVFRADQLVKRSTADYPVLPTRRVLIQELAAVSEEELEYIFGELPADYQLTVSLKWNELELVGNKLHILYTRGVCFYLSRDSSDMTPSLSDMIRTLPVTLGDASQLVHNGYEIASLSVYEESRFLDMLRLTDMRYAVRTPPKRVAIFGKRDTQPDTPAYKIAHEIALGVVSRGFQVITGGYVGIMEAANSGALLGENNINGESMSEGILSPSIFFRNIRGNKSLSKRYVTHGVNQRTDKLVEDSSVLVVMPGGVGTLTEFMVALGMTAVDSHDKLPGYPRVILACRDPWQSMVETSWELINGNLSQLECVEYFDTAEEAIEMVESKYELLVKSTQF